MPKTQSTQQTTSADLLRRVQDHLTKYVAFSNEHHALVLSLWIMHTHAFEAAYVTPYIYVSSIDPGAGKTTLMDTVADLALSPLKSDTISASYMFRKIEQDRPTLIIDEVDTLYSGSKNEELRAVLNGGYLYNGKTSKTINGEPTEFSTFCPKLIGGIDNGQVPETVMDRCMRIRLRKLSGDKLAELNITRRNIKKLARDEELDQLRQDLARWATVDLVDKLSDIEPQTMEGLSARQWDIAEPLVQIAVMVGAQDEARASIAAIFKGEKVETDETRILNAARELFTDETDRITNAQLAEVTGHTADRLSRLLSPLGVKSRPIKVAGKTTRGYYRTEFEAAWERFL